MGLYNIDKLADARKMERKLLQTLNNLCNNFEPVQEISSEQDCEIIEGDGTCLRFD
jgi:hypothetical protein